MLRVPTPFGDPSDSYLLGKLEGQPVAFLARHGRGHRLLPSELNFRANIYGFKRLGVRQIISASAVGSLKIEHAPMDFVLPGSIRRPHVQSSLHLLRGRDRGSREPGRPESAAT